MTDDNGEIRDPTAAELAPQKAIARVIRAAQDFRPLYNGVGHFEDTPPGLTEAADELWSALNALEGAQTAMK